MKLVQFIEVRGEFAGFRQNAGVVNDDTNRRDRAEERLYAVQH